MSNTPAWGETHEALLRLWAVYWKIKDTDEAMAECYKVEVILPLTYSISSRVKEIARLSEENQRAVALERKRKMRWKRWAKLAFTLAYSGEMKLYEYPPELPSALERRTLRSEEL